MSFMCGTADRQPCALHCIGHNVVLPILRDLSHQGRNFVASFASNRADQAHKIYCRHSTYANRLCFDLDTIVLPRWSCNN